MKEFVLVVFVFLISDAFALKMVSRSSWGARAPKNRSNLKSPVPRVFIHHTVTPKCASMRVCSAQLKSIQNYHMNNKGWSDIGYSFLMDSNGVVYEGRGWRAVGAHTFNFNSIAIGISFIGDYTSMGPTAAQKKALDELIAFGIKNNYIKPNYLINGHRDVVCTACPGNKLYAYVKTFPNFDKNQKGKC